ncbi:MAG: hypothetical protein ABI205_09510 [Gemmatimonadaceae bacterium]
MPNAVRVSDLGALTTAERSGVLGRLADESMGEPNGRADAALARVRQYEMTYEFKSEFLGERLRSGATKETNEIVHWLYCLRILELSGR